MICIEDWQFWVFVTIIWLYAIRDIFYPLFKYILKKLGVI